MPDFIGLSDLEHDSAFVTREVDRRLRSDGPLSLELIPWPKPTGGHRNLAVLDPIDEIAMRVAVTPIIHRFGRSLHRNVFSGQLRTGGPGWHFASARSATRELRSHLSRQVEDPSFVSLLRTDVASFYPSLTPNVTQDLTGWFDPDSKYLHYLDRFFEEWRTEGLIGLPIGPEVSLLLANCALSPLDHLIDLLGYPFGRYTDDVSVLNLAPEDQESFIELTDEVLTKLGLMRSQPKTEFTTEPAVALEWVRDSAIASTANVLSSDQFLGELATATMFEAELKAENPDPSRISFALKFFENRGITRAAAHLAQRREIVELNPRVAGDYLEAIGSRSPSTLDSLLETVRSGSRATGTDTHLLRAASSRVWGKSDGRILRDITLDERTPAINRAWAVLAWSRSKDFDLNLAVDLSLYGSDSLSRASCIALRRARPRRVRQASRHISRVRPALTHTCRWVRGLGSV